MIVWLSGDVMKILEDRFLIHHQGLGYEVYASSLYLEGLTLAAKVECWIYHHIREDLFQLFGFQSWAEREFFLSLLKVNGVGPKMAIKILSSQPFSKLMQIIENGDVKGLTGLPKIGKKTAEQIILTLKGKLVIDEGETISSFKERTHIVSALIHLGFKVDQVEEAVNTLDPQVSLQEGVRRCLALLSGGL